MEPSDDLHTVPHPESNHDSLSRNYGAHNCRGETEKYYACGMSYVQWGIIIIIIIIIIKEFMYRDTTNVEPEMYD